MRGTRPGARRARTGDLGQVVLPEREAPRPLAAERARAAQRAPRLLGVGEGAVRAAARGQQHAVCGEAGVSARRPAHTGRPAGETARAYASGWPRRSPATACTPPARTPARRPASAVPPCPCSRSAHIRSSVIEARARTASSFTSVRGRLLCSTENFGFAEKDSKSSPKPILAIRETDLDFCFH